MKTIYIINISFLIASAGWFSSCSTSEGKDQSENPNATSAVVVKVATVAEEDMAIPIHTIGKVSSQLESSLSFKTSGIIKRILVKNGQQVKKHQLLAELDLSEIRGTHRKTKAAFEKAQRELRRVENLYKERVATLEALENARTAVDITKSDLEIVAFNMDHSMIKAPSNGVILGKQAEAGELTSAGRTILQFGSTNQNWIIKAGLIDKEIVRVNLGDHSEVNFDAYPGISFKGHVSKIASAPDAGTGTYEVEVALDEVPNLIKKGFISKLSIIPSGTQKYTIVPVEALVEAENKEGLIYKLEGQNPIKVDVRIETIIGDKVLVQGDINALDQVITEGASEIGKGSLVKVL